jgi:hypothetical protein
MEGCVKDLCKYNAILWKGLEYLQILVLMGIIIKAHRNEGMTVSAYSTSASPFFPFISLIFKTQSKLNLARILA